MSYGVYILAGGKGERFGSDKARLEVSGKPNWERIADALAPLGEVAILEGTPGRLSHHPLRCVPDRIGESGPLGGLEAALNDGSQQGHDAVFLISVDMVGFQMSWARDLLQACSTQLAAAYYDTRWQPLFAAYQTKILPTVQERLAAKHLAMWRLLDALETQALHLPAGWENLISINSPADLERL